jgi:large subunit ribosomal protein L7/L12
MNFSLLLLLRPQIAPAKSHHFINNTIVVVISIATFPYKMMRSILRPRITRSLTLSSSLSQCSRVYLSTQPQEFKHPKAQALFEKIVATCSREDISALSKQVHKILGISISPNEFYYHGFGGKSSKAASEVVGAPVVEAPKQFDIKLVGFDASAKIKVIKEVRAIAGLGLKEAKDLVESLPKVVQKGVKPEQAEELKKTLEAIGAQVELVA